MVKAYSKMSMRAVRRTFARFLAIFGISMLGVGFLCGLLATTPDMQNTADNYYDTYKLFDVDIRSGLGVTEADAAALAKQDYVDEAICAYASDAEVSDGETGYVARIYGMPMGDGSDTGINSVELIEGRMPQNSGECVLASPNGYAGVHKVGEKYTLARDAAAYEDIKERYTFDVLEVVGIVRSPNYISVESEASSVGTGSVSLVLYVPYSAYDMQAYTDIFLTVKDAYELNAFSEDYERVIEDAKKQIEVLGEARARIRYNTVRAEAQGKLDSAKEEYEREKAKAQKELDDAAADIANGRQKLSDAEAELQNGWYDYNKGAVQLVQARGTLESETAQRRADLESQKPYITQQMYEGYAAAIDKGYADALAAINEQEGQLSNAYSTLKSAEEEIAANKTELAYGEKDYEEAKAKADKELEDARADIDSAQSDIDDIELPEWYLSDRQDTVSFSSYKSNSEKVAAIAKIFPIFFFTVAALVALTTMTRLVDEERQQMGTLKSLGYTKWAILRYYLLYSITASLAGGVAGAVVGFRVFPVVIANAYGMMYTLPPTITSFYWSYALLTIGAMELCIFVSTLWACLAQLHEKPSRLLLPKAPPVGKRIFLERIPFVWKRLSFITKVTARNIFRYKKRLYMTVFGIAGCCALLVAAFGLRVSIHAIVDKQFGEIYKYDVTMYLAKDSAEVGDLDKVMGDSALVERSALMHSENATVNAGGKEKKLTIVVPKETQDLKENIILRNRLSGEDIPFDESSVVLTEKLCEQLAIKVGDSVEIRNDEGRSAAFNVSGITENYVAGSVFMSASAYESAFGAAPKYRMVFLKSSAHTDSDRDALSQKLLANDDIIMLRFTDTIRESFENTVKSIDYIVLVLIFSAGALAVIVLYNLTNINICERRKELATIKVLGFRNAETASYIYRETNILSFFGVIVGFGLGAWLHSFVVRSAEVDMVMFGRTLTWDSLLWAALITAAFTAVVDLILMRKLHGIDMVESMKAPE